MTPHNFIKRCRELVEAYDCFDTPDAFLVAEDLLAAGHEYQSYKDDEALSRPIKESQART